MKVVRPSSSSTLAASTRPASSSYYSSYGTSSRPPTRTSAASSSSTVYIAPKGTRAGRRVDALASSIGLDRVGFPLSASKSALLRAKGTTKFDLAIAKAESVYTQPPNTGPTSPYEAKEKLAALETLLDQFDVESEMRSDLLNLIATNSLPRVRERTTLNRSNTDAAAYAAHREVADRQYVSRGVRIPSFEPPNDQHAAAAARAATPTSQMRASLLLDGRDGGGAARPSSSPVKRGPPLVSLADEHFFRLPVTRPPTAPTRKAPALPPPSAARSTASLSDAASDATTPEGLAGRPTKNIPSTIRASNPMSFTDLGLHFQSNRPSTPTFIQPGTISGGLVVTRTAKINSRYAASSPTVWMSSLRASTWLDRTTSVAKQLPSRRNRASPPPTPEPRDEDDDNDLHQRFSPTAQLEGEGFDHGFEPGSEEALAAEAAARKAERRRQRMEQYAEEEI